MSGQSGADGERINIVGACRGFQFGTNNTVNVIGQFPCRDQNPASKKTKTIKPKKQLTSSVRTPTKDQIDKICVLIDKYDDKMKMIAWKELGVKLGLSQGEVETVQHDFNLSGMHEMCYQMLRKWKERQPMPHQAKVLAQALYDIGRGDLSDILAD